MFPTETGASASIQTPPAAFLVLLSPRTQENSSDARFFAPEQKKKITEPLTACSLFPLGCSSKRLECCCVSTAAVKWQQPPRAVTSPFHFPVHVTTSFHPEQRSVAGLGHKNRTQNNFRCWAGGDFCTSDTFTRTNVFIALEKLNMHVMTDYTDVLPPDRKVCINYWSEAWGWVTMNNTIIESQC